MTELVHVNQDQWLNAELRSESTIKKAGEWYSRYVMLKTSHWNKAGQAQRRLSRLREDLLVKFGNSCFHSF